MTVVEVIIGIALVVVAAVLLDVAVSGGGVISEFEMLSQFALAVVLAAYLYYRHRRRMRRLPPEPKDWTGKGFDASGISPKIARVRENYLPEKPAPASHFHRGLLAFAREAVSRLGFFQDRRF
jgi:hypothetical protein